VPAGLKGEAAGPASNAALFGANVGDDHHVTVLGSKPGASTDGILLNTGGEISPLGSKPDSTGEGIL
jgi:hypothetical protein